MCWGMLLIKAIHVPSRNILNFLSVDTEIICCYLLNNQLILLLLKFEPFMWIVDSYGISGIKGIVALHFSSS